MSVMRRLCRTILVNLILAAGSSATARAAELPGAGCEIDGTDPRGADAVRARTACEIARGRFAELFGEPASSVRVVLWERGGYRVTVREGVAIIFWPTSRALSDRTRPGGLAQEYIADQWRNVLPHETAHVLLAARFFGEERGRSSADYGTPFPDWFDEGVAIWAESVESRTGRLDDFRKLPVQQSDLRSILVMRHPAAHDDNTLAVRDGAPFPRDERLWTFYPQSFAVLLFIFDAGGRDAVRELARRLEAGRDGIEALAGLGGLPADAEGVVAAWDRWRNAASRTRPGS